MKHLIFLLVPIFASAWSFTAKDYRQLSPEQLHNINISYLVGVEKDLGLTLASIAIVETRASVDNDFNDNHVCGLHQLDVNFVNVSCRDIESNPFLSAKLALDNFLFWYNGPANKSWRKALIMYNGGYRPNPHANEYLRRIVMVYKVLKDNL